ncbi:hypothetical protein RUM43_001799 [Polyplax serrata]|uniref:Uncharacterized protein n=1 Tax=Polyplax serrata TaxID=468196 RepID=A0AAN8XUK7_POLSC
MSEINLIDRWKSISRDKSAGFERFYKEIRIGNQGRSDSDLRSLKTFTGFHSIVSVPAVRRKNPDLSLALTELKARKALRHLREKKDGDDDDDDDDEGGDGDGDARNDNTNANVFAGKRIFTSLTDLHTSRFHHMPTCDTHAFDNGTMSDSEGGNQKAFGI